MAKQDEKKIARWYFVHKGKSLKEIGDELKVSAKTLSNWCTKENWKAERTAVVSSPETRQKNIKQIITSLADERIDLHNKLLEAEKKKENAVISDIRKQIAGIDAAVANWNKTLLTLEKETKVTLAQYLYVMDRVFTAMRKLDEPLFFKSIQFQEIHLNEIVIELG